MIKGRRRLIETMKQLSYDKPVIDRQAIKIRKSLDDVKKSLEQGWKKKPKTKEENKKEEAEK